jgi:ABC-type sugar transport system permease subunit
VLLYSMGIGTIAVAALLFLVLMVVCLYGQLVWSFTHWDLADVRLTPFKPLAYFLLAGTFIGGTCVGLWCFSGAAWKKSSSVRSGAVRRGTR